MRRPVAAPAAVTLLALLLTTSAATPAAPTTPAAAARTTAPTAAGTTAGTAGSTTAGTAGTAGSTSADASAGTDAGIVGGPAPPATPANPTVELAVRGAAADAFARSRGGRTGIVVRDRVTGATWRNADAGTAFRAASTVKLGIAIDLLVRARAAGTPPGPAARSDLTAMLTASDNAAASRLWTPQAGARLAGYGLRAATGTTAWGSIRCTPDDLERLLSYGLERTDPADRATLVGLLRGVVPAQRWGVLGVAGTARPGAKNGWTPDGGSWAVATVGFLGPAERYTVAVMTAGPPGGDFLGGVETVTGTVTTLFLGLA